MVSKVAGVDVARGAWYVAMFDLEARSLEGRLCGHFGEVLVATAGCSAVAVDIPIGLTERGPRLCDLRARGMLGRQASSVFPPPLRPMLSAMSRIEADAIRRQIEGKGVPAQAFGIVSKIREVDQLITPDLQMRVVETHPELAFRHLAGVVGKKREPEGFEARRLALEAVLPPFAHLLAARSSKWAPDDVLDALVCAWVAKGIAGDTAERVPEEPEIDAKGLRMEMWF
jgi:predicted RNase H-like nuclease